MVFSQLGQDDSIYAEERAESCQLWGEEKRKTDGNFTPFLFPPQGHADLVLTETENFQCLALGFQFIVYIPLSFWDNLVKKIHLVSWILRKIMMLVKPTGLMG